MFGIKGILGFILYLVFALGLYNKLCNEFGKIGEKNDE